MSITKVITIPVTINCDGCFCDYCQHNTCTEDEENFCQIYGVPLPTIQEEAPQQYQWDYDQCNSIYWNDIYKPYQIVRPRECYDEFGE